jgi:AraC family transcriptional regulator of adaptative response/methylated-DNA-[protein]-cysteine methyltransferase
MSPRAYQRGGQGERIAYGFGDSALGRFLVAATPRGVCALRLGDPGSDAALLAELRAEFPRAALEQDPEAVAPQLAAVRAHLEGRRGLALPLDVRATDFQRRVWQALQAIPYGETRSYQEVAAMIGEPKAVRAVARACATNPVALVVPCHRVVRATGALSGYRWGLERKAALLAHEREAAGETEANHPG